MAVLQLLGWDFPPERAVAVAVELIDPVSGRITSNGLTVTLQGRSSKPITSSSGRLVWIGDVENWPAALSVDCGAQPFRSIVNQSLIALRPASWPKPKPHERLIRVRLTPTSVYPFTDGVTAIQGWLFENDPPTPIADAELSFEWAVAGTAAWQPIDPNLSVRTDNQGRFGVYARIRGTAAQEPDVAHGLVKIHIVVTRGAQTKRSPDTFQFLPPPAATGRIPDGAPLPEWVALDWGVLV